MKRLLLIPLLALMSLVAFAQEIPPERWVLGGSFRIGTQSNSIPIYTLGASFPGFYYSSRDTESSFFLIALHPYLAKRVNKNWHIGGALTIGFDYRKGLYATALSGIGGDHYEENNFNYGISVFGRYTINPDKKLNVYVQPSIDLSFFTSGGYMGNLELEHQKGYIFGGYVPVGLAYELTEKWRIRTTLGTLRMYSGKMTSDEDALPFSVIELKGIASGTSFSIEMKF